MRPADLPQSSTPQVPFKPFLPEEDEPGEPAASYSYALAEAAAAARGTMQGHEVRRSLCSGVAGAGSRGRQGQLVRLREGHGGCSVVQRMVHGGGGIHSLQQKGPEGLCVGVCRFCHCLPMQLRLVWPGGGWQGVWRQQLLPGERALSGEE